MAILYVEMINPTHSVQSVDFHFERRHITVRLKLLTMFTILNHPLNHILSL